MKRGLVWAAALLLLFLVLALLYGEDLAEKAQVGKAAPPVTLPSLEGAVQTYPQGGRWVLLNFFASWCDPCREEIPLLQSLQDEFPQTLLVVGIAWRDGQKEVASFVEELQVRYPVLRDGEGKAGRQYGLTGVPESWLIDPEGVAVLHIRGPVTSQTEEEIRRFLKGDQP
ncbi:MAG: redoxin domain-containing protein [Bacillota bacterium]|nr:redoxin domain-containing protein [Bacillota bacterium]